MISSLRQALFWTALSVVFCPVLLHGQTNGSGMLQGQISDASGAAVASAAVVVTNESTSQQRKLVSNSLGLYAAPLLPPALYTIAVTSSGFGEVTLEHVAVNVSGTQTLDIRMRANSSEHVEVSTNQSGVEDAPNRGSVTGHMLVANLPLAARNYTQILGLNVGIASEVADAGAVGRGSTSYSGGPGGFSSNGAATNDNNFQMDGLDVNDIQGSGYISRGVPVPNPDAIEEFRVSTQPYDASQGRNSGANINIVTRSGSTLLHGSLFEYFRNDAMNANSYFRNATGQRRPSLKQNQFGATLGGPIYKPLLLGFGSYQETRQSNGLDSSCSSSVALPPLTNDRTAGGLGAVFVGQRGFFQDTLGGVGPAIAVNGSNISPVALALLQRKNADGSFLIPTPQVVNATGNFDSRGLSTFSIACPYVEHQGVANLDAQPSESHRISIHSFASNSSTEGTLPAPLLGGSTVPSSPYQLTDRFRTISIAHTWIVRTNLLNQAQFGFNRLRGTYVQRHPFSFSEIGAQVPSFDDAAPVLNIAGASIGGGGESVSAAVNTFVVQDVVTYTRGRHFLHLGGGLTRVQDNQPYISFYGALKFLRFSDFLLGQSAAQNGTAALCAFAGCGAGYSDIAYSQDIPGTIQREYRLLSHNAYVQDDIRLSSRLTINAGIRYERLGDLADRLGHNTSFYPSLANLNPSATGSLAGYVVPANYTGPVPTGVTRLSNDYGINGDGQNTWQPRVGLAWQLPGGDKVMLRVGYGLFRSRITADAYNQSVVTPPFARLRQYLAGDPASASLSLSQPIPAFNTALPSFTPYCAPTANTCTETPVFNGLAPNVRPPLFHRYNFDIESRLTPTLTFDLGYVGSRGQNLITQVSINQAALANASAPVRGVTTNTLANVALRVPLPGWNVNNLTQIQSSGSSLYNALQASLRRRSTSVGEFLVSYTWARGLSDTYGSVTALHGGTILSDQTDRSANYGPDLFLREHRVVATYLLNIPAPRTNALRRIIGRWQFAGVALAQSGHSLSVTYQNQFSAYGITNDRASLVPNCNPLRSGAAIDRLNGWFNAACFTTPAVIGDDRVATGFGNSPLGFIKGPRQANIDASLQRTFVLRETAAINFRAESFNLFNHAQFADPDTELSSASFGQIRSTSVNPRVIQVSLRASF